MGNNFKYYGDEYLLLNNVFGDMTIHDQIIFTSQTGFELLSQNEIPYLIGLKTELIKQIACSNGISRVFKSNPEKYRKIWLMPNRRQKIAFTNNGQPMETKKEHQMFQ